MWHTLHHSRWGGKSFEGRKHSCSAYKSQVTPYGTYFCNFILTRKKKLIDHLNLVENLLFLTGHVVWQQSSSVFGLRPVSQLYFGTVMKSRHRFCPIEEGIKDSREKVEERYSFFGKNLSSSFQKEKDFSVPSSHG